MKSRFLGFIASFLITAITLGDALATSTPSTPPPAAAPATQDVTSTQAPAATAPATQDVTSTQAPAATAPAQGITSTQAPAAVSQDSSTTTATPKSAYADDRLIVIGTGAVSGVYYPAGGAICRMLNRERKTLGLKCAVESTSGSIENLKSLKNGELDFALVQSDWQEHAFNGTSEFSKLGRINTLRFVMSLHNEALTIVVPKKSDIQKFEDLKGRNINVGPEGSGVRATIDEIFKAKGWTKQDFKALSELKSDEQGKVLCDNGIDAMIIASGHPNGDLQDVSNMCDIRIIEVDDNDIQKVVLTNPEFSYTIIPGGVYPGIPTDIKTIGFKATLVTTLDANEEVVYNLTKLVIDNLDTFKSFHPVFAQLDATKMATEGKTAPYHPGAQKYFIEKGYIKP